MVTSFVCVTSSSVIVPSFVKHFQTKLLGNFPANSLIFWYAENFFHMIIQVGQKFSQPPAEDPYYVRTRSMLNKLGLQNYEKNFKRGLLTDNTLPLLTDRQVAGLIAPIHRFILTGLSFCARVSCFDIL